MKAAILIANLFIPSLSYADVLIGTARNSKGEVVYLERHHIQKDEAGLNKLIRVEYMKPGGEVFATMTSDFSKNKMIPETVFEDMRFKTKSTLRVLATAVEFQEFKNEISMSQSFQPLSGLMVAGQGFDNFIRKHSGDLANGPLKFRFGVLSKMDFYSLTGYRRESNSSGVIEYGIKASNWLARLFASELRITYDAESMRLKSFSGRSNISDDRGRAQNVTIDYEWSDS